MPFNWHPSPAKGAWLALLSTIFSLWEILLVWANDLFARLFYYWLFEYTEEGEEERKKWVVSTFNWGKQQYKERLFNRYKYTPQELGEGNQNNYGS